MREELLRYENVAVSTRIRLARNFADYPFPGRLGAQAAREIVNIVSAELKQLDAFELRLMNTIPARQAELLAERYLISRDLIRNRAHSAVLLSRLEDPCDSFEKELKDTLEENVSVMINEEDHIREQYFMRGFDLQRGYERLSGIDDIISETIPFAFDRELGYLTACPTNLGTGLRASVMLFLPALSRRGKMREYSTVLRSKGLAVRGAFGEGSGAEGDLYQVSNEVTLGYSEEEILAVVSKKVSEIIEDELLEREQLLEEGGVALSDRILRSYGVLVNCAKVDVHEFFERLSDVKLGVALGVLDGEMADLDMLLVATRPANLSFLYGAPFAEEEQQDIFRAQYAGRFLRRMGMLDEEKRDSLFPKTSPSDLFIKE